MTGNRPPAGGVDVRRRIGRWVQLVPVERRHYDAFWELASSDEVSWPWRHRPVNVEFLVETLAESLAQFSVVDRRTNELIGLVRADKASLFHEHAYVGLFLRPDLHRRGWPVEALPLFIDHLFSRYKLRKIYGETSERAVDVGMLAGMAKLEGTLRDHFYVDGEWVDCNIVSIHKDDWYATVRPMLGDHLWRDVARA